MRRRLLAAALVTSLWITIAPAEAASGEVVWSARWSPATRLWVAGAVVPRGGPVITAGCFGTDHIGLVLANDRSTGALRWSRRINGPGTWDCVDVVTATPDGRTVIVAGVRWGKSGSGPLRFDVAIRAYDARTGTVRWTQRVCPQCFGVSVRPLAVTPDGRSMVVPLSVADGRGARVFRFDLDTGARRWKVATGDGLTSFAVTPDGRTAIGTGSAGGTGRDLVAEAFRISDGRLRWRTTVSSAVPNGRDEGCSIAVAPDGSDAFVAGILDADGASDLVVQAFTVADGATGWQIVDDLPGWPSAALTPDGARLIVSSFDEVRALSPATGHLIWSSTREGLDAVVSAPDGRAIYGSRLVDDRSRTLLFALDPSTGGVSWELTVDAYPGYGLRLGPGAATGIATATIVQTTITGRDVLTTLYRG